MSGNTPSKKHPTIILRWHIPRKPSDEDECELQIEKSERRKLERKDIYDIPSELHSNDTITTLEEFTSNVIPASYSISNTNECPPGILKNGRQYQANFLDEVESISSDIADSLTITPKETTLNTDFPQDTQNHESENHESPKISRKRKIASFHLESKQRKQQNKFQVPYHNFTSTQIVKRCIDTDELLKQLKYLDKLTIKDRKRLTSHVKKALIDIREETESVLHGIIPVPDKMHVQMLRRRSQKLCDYLTTLYEEFPSNSQKTLLEEVKQVRETIESELQGILDVLTSFNTSFDRINLMKNHPLPIIPKTQVRIVNTDNEEQADKTVYGNVSLIVTSKILESGKINTNYKLPEKNTQLLVGSSPTIEHEFESELIDLTNSPVNKRGELNPRNDRNSEGSKKKESITNRLNFPQGKKQVHFKIEDLPRKNITEQAIFSEMKNSGPPSNDKNESTPVSLSNGSDKSKEKFPLYSSFPEISQHDSQCTVQGYSLEKHVTSQDSSVFLEKFTENVENVHLKSTFSGNSETNPPNLLNKALIDSTKKTVYINFLNENKSQCISANTRVSSNISHNSNSSKKEGSQTSNKNVNSFTTPKTRYSHQSPGTINSTLISQNVSERVKLSSKITGIPNKYSNNQMEPDNIKTLQAPSITRKSIPSISNEDAHASYLQLTEQNTTENNGKNREIFGITQQASISTCTSFSINDNNKQSSEFTPSLSLPPSQNCSFDPIYCSQVLHSQFDFQSQNKFHCNTENISIEVSAINSADSEEIKQNNSKTMQNRSTNKLSSTEQNKLLSSKSQNQSLKTKDVQMPLNNKIDNDSWVHVVFPKLPWQIGETMPEYEFSEIPMLPNIFQHTQYELRNFKIPKLPWEHFK